MKMVKELLKAAIPGVVIVALALFALKHTEQVKDDMVFSNNAYVFRITNQAGNSGGTGFLINAPSGRTYLMTNQHVCGLAQNGRIFVSGGDGFTYYTTVHEIYPSHDLCLINMPVEMRGLNVAQSVRDNQEIYVLGHPMLEPMTLTKGNIAGETIIQVLVGYDMGEACKGEGFSEVGFGSTTTAEILIERPYQFFFGGVPCVRTLRANPITAKIHPGNSGSPVLNSSGDVVGVAFAGGERDYIIPLRYVKRFLEGK